MTLIGNTKRQEDDVPSAFCNTSSVCNGSGHSVTLRSLLTFAILLPIGAEGCELSVRSLLDEVSGGNGRGVVSRLWDSGECENAILDRVSTGDAEWLEVALALEPYTDAAAGETLEAAMSQAMQRAPSRVLPLLDQSRFGRGLCVPVSFDDSEGSDQIFRDQLSAARRVYVDYLRTSLGTSARDCLLEIDKIEASLTRPDSTRASASGG